MDAIDHLYIISKKQHKFIHTMKTNHLLLSLGFTGAFSMGHAQEKPNVLFFLVDDLGWNDISANGSKLYETPHIDEVIGESVYFSNAYAAYPRCVPSRYAMITGRHPARDSQTDGINLGLEQVTLAEALKDKGYQTFFAGKWHLGKSEEYWPHHQGFDVNKGGCDAGSPGSYFFPYGDTKFVDTSLYGLEEGKEGEYITDRLTDETIKYIKDHREGPFLVYLAHYAVHTPSRLNRNGWLTTRKSLRDFISRANPLSSGRTAVPRCGRTMQCMLPWSRAWMKASGRS